MELDADFLVLFQSRSDKIRWMMKVIHSVLILVLYKFTRYFENEYFPLPSASQTLI